MRNRVLRQLRQLRHSAQNGEGIKQLQKGLTIKEAIPKILTMTILQERGVNGPRRDSGE
jgi:hypothetical protein